MYLTINLSKNIKWLLLGLLILIIFFYLSLKPTFIPSNSSNMEFKVIIDPGHGSIDTGASYHNIYEKDINLNIAKYLNQELKKVNIIPIMTRKEDKLYLNSRKKDIRHRPEIAKENKADLFISIHVNNFPTSQPTGSHIFYKSGSSLSKILAENIKIELVKLRKENNHSLKKGDYYVLNHSPCPAVLIEVGFLSNPIDRQKLINPDYQQALAYSLKEGIINYFQSRFGKEEIPTKPIDKPQKLDQSNGDSYLYYLTYNDENIYLIRKNLSFPTSNLLDHKYDLLQFNEILVLSALEQLTNPPQGLISPLPQKTKIKSVQVKNKKAVIDFSQELISNFNGGAGLENFIIQAITKTILSIPGIEELEILIEGESNPSIGGHIILNQIIKK